jgi:uncharacterized protein YjbI with pentapeptide repeats
VAVVREQFASWLRLLDLKEAEAKSLANRLPNYLAFAFHEEWRSQRDHYQPIADVYDTPFDPAVQLAWDWERNRLELIRQLDERVFEENFSLRRVYVPLRAYWEERSEEKPGRQTADARFHVVDLATAVRSWLRGGERQGDSACLVFGGPGSGKSTFARHLAASLSADGRFRVLFIALRRFDMEDKIESAVGTYLRRQGLFASNPFEQPDFASARNPLLLIFDGLDELSKPGDYADGETAQFMTRLNSALSQWNGRERTVLALITGRTASAQTHGHALDLGERQQLSVLPYFVSRKERYHDPRGLLGADQRRDWWALYSAAKPGEPPEIPKALLQEDLIELTAEPLLNYLVVLSGYHRDAQSGERVNRNTIYARLYKDVVKRRHAGGKPLAAAKEVSDTEFDRLMEIIAVAAWHGGGRSASMAEIQAGCPDDLKPVLERFLRDRQPARLFAAFYFKAAEDRSRSENAFEFTHKSFGEYLTGLRLVREVWRLDKGLRESPEYMTEDLALRDWCRLTGPRGISMNLLRFLRDEVALRDDGEVECWRNTLTRLFNRNLGIGPPIEAFSDKTYRPTERKARSAEEALLASLSACTLARDRKTLVQVDWPNLLSASEMLHRLHGDGEHYSGASSVVKKCLARFKLSGLSLSREDLVGADLSGADLSRADLSGAHLSRADLSGAHLSRANLFEADLSRANLFEADLSGADLSGAHLSRANLFEASLSEADLSGANLSGAHLCDANFSRAALSGANLFGADLSGAHLSRANLLEANLSGASLSGADLSGAILSGADLSEANLSGASLSGADLSGASLSGADLSEANLSGASLSGADLSGASLSGANLSEADLSGASLSGADLSGADLSGANLSGANLSEANLSEANLSEANLSGANFSEANLSGVKGLAEKRG